MTQQNASMAAQIAGMDRETNIPLRRRIEFVSVVLPCLNEAGGVAATVEEAFRGLDRAGVKGEVIVVDNGSTDGSAELAEAAGARVVRESVKGYGAAHRAGLRAALGNVIVMADADQTYDLEHLGDLLRPLANGANLVVGSRLRGTISKGAMPRLHRYLGTPMLTQMLRILTGVRLTDSQSGYRAFWRDDVLTLDLKAKRLEYQTEMLLKAGRAGWNVVEVPTNYRVRVGESKLSTFRDGWLNLQMLFLLCPHFSLILPGLIAVVLGLLLSGVSLVAPAGVEIGRMRWLPIFLGPLLLILGVQAAFLGSLAAYSSSLTPPAVKRRLSFFERRDAVNRLLGGFLLVALAGMALNALLVTLWLIDRSSQSLLGVAGLAQALIIIGFSGIVSLFAASYSRESFGK